MRTSLTLISDSINNNINSSSKNQLLSMQASAFTIFDMLARALDGTFFLIINF